MAGDFSNDGGSKTAWQYASLNNENKKNGCWCVFYPKLDLGLKGGDPSVTSVKILLQRENSEH